MFTLALGAAVALLIVAVLVTVAAFHAEEPTFRIVPLDDIIKHLNGQCECLPEILVSFGRKYEIHRPVKDIEPMDLRELGALGLG